MKLKILITIIASIVLANLSLSIALAKAESGDFVDGEIVCQVLNPAYIDTINAIYGTTTQQFLTQIDGHLLTAPIGLDAESLALEISLDPNVVYCDANYFLDAPEPVQGSQPFIDQVAGGDFATQPAVAATSLPTAHLISTGTGIKVAVIDVGVDPNHPELAGSIGAGYDYIDGDNDPMDVPGGLASGHGSFVAGIINLVAPDAIILPYRVLDSAGRGSGFVVAEAILQAVADGCKVINLSMVMGGKHGTVDMAIEYARDQNVVTVCAIGNDSLESDLFPASDSYTIAVAALDSNNIKADFSSFGSKVDVCAPGTQIYAPYQDTLYAWWNGSSFAAPFVSGQVALLYAEREQASWNDVVDAIEQTAIGIDSLNPEHINKLGFGLINPTGALNLIGVACGDFNGDDTEGDISDLTYLVDYLFRGGPLPADMNAADVDGSGFGPNISDLTYLVDYLFRQGNDLVCP